jgi:methionyl-tRNA formyltransferase
MNQNVVFFGSGWYTIPVVKKLIPLGLDLVVTTEKNPDSLFLKFCNENNLKTIQVSNASEIINQKSLIINHNVAILASFGEIIPQSLIDTLPHGVINIHPSLLPKFKGPSPIQYTLLSGDPITGVSIIKLDDKVDHGPILAQQPYSLTGNETAEDLLSILFEIGADLTEDIVTKIQKGEKIAETPQDHTLESWSYKIKKNDGYINISTLSSSELEIRNFKLELARKVRAYYPWPGVWFIARIKDKELRIKLLPENKIQPEGKNPMSYKDFLNGYEEEGRNLLIKLGLV